ncbi:SDR family oxidoreductase, partial [Vibrio tubiashii]
MRICVIGSGGLVGSRLSKDLSATHEIIELNRTNGDVVNMDIEMLAGQLGHVDCIVNCAALLDQNDIENLLTTNALGALNVAKLSVLLKAKLIHLSSVSCEQHPKNEYFGPYGISKLTGEHLIKDYLESKTSEYCIVRCSQIYDLEGKAYRSQPFFYNLLNNANKNGQVTLYGNKNVVRNYVSLDTVVKS